MWWRSVPMVLACVVLAAACGQERPSRSPLPDLPEELSFPTTTPTTTDPVPDDGSCYLVESVGALVSSTLPGYDAGTVLESGDVITGIEDAAVTSQETLIGALSSYTPGDRLRVTFERDGETLSDEIELGSLPEDPTQARLGVIIEPSVSATPPDELTAAIAVSPSWHVAIAEDLVFRMDPLAGTWYPTGLPDPRSSVVLIDGEMYVQDPDGGPAIEPLGDGDEIPVPTGGRDLLRILATVDDVLVVLVGNITEDDPTLAENVSMIGVDLEAERVLWAWAPQGVSGEPGNPVFGFRSPDGTRAALSFDVDGSRTIALIDAAGTIIAGFGTDIEIAPRQSVFGGWHDERTLAYVVATEEGLSVQLFDVVELSTTEAVRLETDLSLRQIWSVGDGNHLVVITENEARLFDVAAQRDGRLLARNCTTGIIAGPTS